MLPQPSSYPDINQPPRRWPKRHRRLISRRRAVSASSVTQLQYGATGCSSCNSGNGNTFQVLDASKSLMEVHNDFK